MLTVAAFFVAWAATSAWLGQVLPFPDAAFVRAKVEKLAQHGDDYDILFVGSSRIHYEIEPAVFDRTLGELDVTARSFNAGVVAMRCPEDGYYLEQLLRCPHQRLKWVFFELMPVTEADLVLRGTERNTYWRDGKRTWLLTQHFSSQMADTWSRSGLWTRDWPKKFSVSARLAGAWLEDVTLCAENLSQFGRGWPLLEQKLAPSTKRASAPKRDLVGDGWVSPSTVKPLIQDEKRRAKYERAYAALLAERQRFDAGDAVSFEAVHAKIDLLKSAGITPLLIVPPTVAAKRYLPASVASETSAIMDFSESTKCPELFAVENRLDEDHLSASGAEIFSQALAREFVGRLRKSAQKPPATGL